MVMMKKIDNGDNGACVGKPKKKIACNINWKIDLSIYFS